ncbi:hypothetical protein [Enterovirga aerilata]|uniref:Uncharacterized protein n=1 Tax=Enterovirga aerilata TaxID=2730920 RepID=A0A849IEV4_9HYPH|nr:hypothetical protein [Enterovirga sp. DB1703]NNM74755.1 hypothetical protein [Enterovirga sp. DB1703]
MATQQTVYEARGTLKRILVNDPLDGFYGQFTAVAEQECEPLIEENKALREMQTGKERFRLVARVPVPIYEQALREGWAYDDAKWRKWLNDPDNRAFRVSEERV